SVTTAPLQQLLVPPTATVRDAMTCIDRARSGIALVVEEDGVLLGTITDGDLRRAMLAAVELEAPVTELLARQRELREPRPMPRTAPVGTRAAEVVASMRRDDVRQIPLVDEGGRVRGLARLEELVADDGPALGAVVLAGGFGTRLGDLT